MLFALLLIPTNIALAEECTNYMHAFNKHQLVIKSMMDMNFAGKMNADVGDKIGSRLKEAQGPLDSGEFNKACEIYDSIIADYGFDTSFGEAPAKETKPPQYKRRTKNTLIAEAMYTQNQAKWAAAEEFCLDQGWKFQIMTEKELGV